MNTFAKSTVTSKGQITIPKEIRDHLHLQSGDQIEFQIDQHGQVIMRARNVDFHSLKGIIRSKRKTPVTIEEMNEAIARGWSGT